MYPEFQYFLEAYCTQSIETEEVWDVIGQFKKNENPEVQRSLLAECQEILNHGDLAAAREMIQEHGYRQFSDEKTTNWLKHIVKKLQKERA
ncbi:contact-dependent growth inhibition system immunity protein [Scopulibacillus cellulosilyticus]|uniref:Contact-dependent growth inhibition system immunity protein n=1 Tax=Scopulibacillus cellulosilyticus TaxID=2665665 RepID=A0ABW2PX76_9BACL